MPNLHDDRTTGGAITIKKVSKPFFFIVNYPSVEKMSIYYAVFHLYISKFICDRSPHSEQLCLKKHFCQSNLSFLGFSVEDGNTYVFLFVF